VSRITEGPVNPMSYGDGKLCARIDIMKASQVDEVGLDDTVAVMVKGKVKSLRGKEEYKSRDYDAATEKGREKMIKRVIPGSIELEVEEMTVLREGEFDGLMKDYEA
jgi:hypothetical protein